jgi:histidyl-tRNA synthetase
VVAQGDDTPPYALVLAEELRAAGYAVVQHAGGGSFKSQLKRADASGAWIALIVGEEEVRAQQVAVKLLRRTEPQFSVRRDEVVSGFRDALQRARS